MLHRLNVFGGPATHLVLALVLALPFAGNAQIGGGALRGLVTNASSATVPGSQIKAVNVDTNVPSTTTSNDSGYYEFPLLPSGRYYVEASREGFRPVRSAEFTLSTGTVPRIDLTMPGGSDHQLR